MKFPDLRAPPQVVERRQAEVGGAVSRRVDAVADLLVVHLACTQTAENPLYKCVTKKAQVL